MNAPYRGLAVALVPTGGTTDTARVHFAINNDTLRWVKDVELGPIPDGEHRLSFDEPVPTYRDGRGDLLLTARVDATLQHTTWAVMHRGVEVSDLREVFRRVLEDEPLVFIVGHTPEARDAARAEMADRLLTALNDFLGAGIQ